MQRDETQQRIRCYRGPREMHAKTNWTKLSINILRDIRFEWRVKYFFGNFFKLTGFRKATEKLRRLVDHVNKLSVFFIHFLSSLFDKI